ncbi:2-phosphosulfolactate phosphatase XcbC [Methylotetracoccus oryzae]|uniref:argininosuccinate lyase n=1 Tax=Methylotetracoccus oryzae TaxID=1919059 RepID=UPI00111AAD67|nr:argininosuccinate lyase [Methylotetracoccus oryzae]
MSIDPDYDPTVGVASQVLEVGSRLAEGPSARLVDTVFRRELADQAGLFAALGLTDLAHTLAMIEVGVIPAAEGSELLGALLKLQTQPEDFHADPIRGDLYTNREAWLAVRTSAAGWLGIGRARREATTTAFLMTLRAALLDLADASTRLGHTLTTRASEWREALMPDYTYLQAAQPTTFGHYLAGFAEPLLRDGDRLRGVYSRVNRSPAGCGSTNGSRLTQPRERLAELLGFDGLVRHARDAMWQADLPIETAGLMTTMLINLDRLAEDLQIFATREFGLVELDDRHARASKIMPHKKNPFALTHIRGMANAMIGTLAATAAAARTPSGQSDNRLALYGAIPRAVADTRDAVLLLDEVIAALRFDARRGLELLAGSDAAATDIAEVLVTECSLDFRQAHRLVGTLVRQTAGLRPLSALSVNELTACSIEVLGFRAELTPAALVRALDPKASVHARIGPGGAAPPALDAVLADQRAGLAEIRAWTAEQQERQRASEESLLQRCRERCPT